MISAEDIVLQNNKIIKIVGRKLYIKCYSCNNILSRHVSEFKKTIPKYLFCSRECKHKHGHLYPCSEERKKFYSEKFAGENNPNYNNKWSEEQREALSEKCIERYKDQDYYEKFCDANRNRAWSEEGKKSLSEAVRKRMIGLSRPHSEESKIKIGIKSKEKWTEEYKNKHKDTMIKLGYYKSEEDKTESEIYFNQANWIERMFDYITDPIQLEMLNSLGVFSANNTKGIVRDHIYGRVNGFKNKVPYYIVRHPSNCQLLTTRQNVQKAWNGDMGISLEDLYQKILEFDMEWGEQELCVNYIKSTDWFKDRHS